jgi:hypothetical protein
VTLVPHCAQNLFAIGLFNSVSSNAASAGLFGGYPQIWLSAPTLLGTRLTLENGRLPRLVCRPKLLSVPYSH